MKHAVVAIADLERIVDHRQLFSIDLDEVLPGAIVDRVQLRRFDEWDAINAGVVCKLQVAGDGKEVVYAWDHPAKI